MNLSIFLACLFSVGAFCSELSKNSDLPWVFHQSSAHDNNVHLDEPMPPFVVSRHFDTTGYNRSKIITILVSTTYSGEMPVGSIATKAMELALDRLHLQENWLPGYNVVLEVVDDQCIDSNTINLVVPKLRESDKYYNRFPIFLDPACEAFGLKTVAESLKYFNHVGVCIFFNLNLF